MNLNDIIGGLIIFSIATVSAYIGFHILAYFSHSEEKKVKGKTFIRFFIVFGITMCIMTLIGIPIDVYSNISKSNK